MIYKSYTLNCYFHKIEKRYISFCSFLASISPGTSANFSCSSRKSSGVVLSFKTLTSFFRPSTSLLRYHVLHQTQLVFAPASLPSRTLYYILSSIILEKVLRNILYWANGARFCKIRILQNITAFVKEHILWSAQIQQ